jgi:hypothetical protein
LVIARATDGEGPKAFSLRLTWIVSGFALASANPSLLRLADAATMPEYLSSERRVIGFKVLLLVVKSSPNFSQPSHY